MTINYMPGKRKKSCSLKVAQWVFQLHCVMMTFMKSTIDRTMMTMLPMSVLIAA